MSKFLHNDNNDDAKAIAIPLKTDKLLKISFYPFPDIKTLALSKLKVI